MQIGCCRINPKNWESRHRRSSPQRKVRMRKSRLWTAAFSAVVGLAALVVLASCQGPVGDTGAAGAAGRTGPAGPAGPAGPGGPGDNAGRRRGGPSRHSIWPMVGTKTKSAAGEKVRLPLPRLTGSYGSVVIDLNSYFTDAKTPSLSYTAESSDKTIASVNASATTNVVTGATLTVKAAGVGTATSAMATITVSAYDGVNDPLTKSFDVVVVKKNSPPTVAVITQSTIWSIRSAAARWNSSRKQEASCTRRMERSRSSSRRPSIQGPSARARTAVKESSRSGLLATRLLTPW